VACWPAPAVILVELIVQPLQIVEAPDIVECEVCLAHIHVFCWKLCQLHNRYPLMNMGFTFAGHPTLWQVDLEGRIGRCLDADDGR